MACSFKIIEYADGTISLGSFSPKTLTSMPLILSSVAAVSSLGMRKPKTFTSNPEIFSSLQVFVSVSGMPIFREADITSTPKLCITTIAVQLRFGLPL